MSFPLTSRFVLFSVFGMVLALSGCAEKSKKNGGLGDDSSLPGGGGGVDDLGNTPQTPRPDINPLTDVDYATLSPYTVLFAFDSSVIQSSERGKLEKVAEYLKENAARQIMLAGHTDIRGTLEYNRGLGERRALAVRTYLIGLGVEAGRLNTISYGEEMPAQTGDNESAYSQNRRVQVGLIKQ